MADAHNEIHWEGDLLGGIPGLKKKKWYTKEAAVEGFSTVPPIASAGVATVTTYLDPSKPIWLVILLTLTTAWLIGVGAVRFFRGKEKDKESEDRTSPRDLAGCAHVLYRLLCRRCGIEDGNGRRLRITIHRVVPLAKPGGEPQELEQVIPYVGGRGGEPGRRFSIKSGVIGLTARKHAPHAFSWNGQNPGQFIQELVNQWNYTQEEAERLVTFRRSWLAVPLNGKNDKETVGVVFMDSDDADFFTGVVKELVLDACFGIAAYIQERYG